MYAMRRRATFILAVAAAAAACVAVVPDASAAPARPAGPAQRLATSNPWGRAQEVPGTAALNKAHDAEITSVSCASAGNCSAGGYYAAAYGEYGTPITQPLVVSEVDGTWRKAEEVASPAGVSKNDWAGEVTSVSCASAGNCSAAVGGQFAVSEVHGTWQRARVVPGIAGLSKGEAGITSLSCASAGNCGAGGYYLSGYAANGTEAFQAFVVSEVHGTWRRAETVPGTAALNKDGRAGIRSVSCGSAGNCGAGGYYTAGYVTHAFVVSEVRGTWRKAKEVHGTAVLNEAGGAEIASMSCASAGNCSAGGSGVVSEVDGTWRKARELPVTAALSGSGGVGITSVSCASAGNCSAGGSYSSGQHANGTEIFQAFVASEVNGSWRKAAEVRGIVGLNKGGSAEITSVSCASAGNCSAGGYYATGHRAANGADISEAFVVSEVNGIWRRAEEVPGAAALSKGRGAQVTSVSCGSAGHCSAGGYYLAAFGGEAFVVSRK